MKNSFYEIYDVLTNGIQSGSYVRQCGSGELWGYAESDSGLGVAMQTPGTSIPPMYPQLTGMPVEKAAAAAASWNLEEATLALASANSWYNTLPRIERYHCLEREENYGTEGLDFSGKTVGIVGHMSGTKELWEKAAKVYRTERCPQEGDYPDAASDALLPLCDIVLITGSSMVNKTLPHLLELCQNAYVILTGPSVPLCPDLLDLGIDRLCGVVFTETEAMKESVRNGVHGNPMKYGVKFTLKK